MKFVLTSEMQWLPLARWPVTSAQSCHCQARLPLSSLAACSWKQPMDCYCWFYVEAVVVIYYNGVGRNYQLFCISISVHPRTKTNPFSGSFYWMKRIRCVCVYIYSGKLCDWCFQHGRWICVSCCISLNVPYSTIYIKSQHIRNKSMAHLYEMQRLCQCKYVRKYKEAIFCMLFVHHNVMMIIIR